MFAARENGNTKCRGPEMIAPRRDLTVLVPDPELARGLFVRDDVNSHLLPQILQEADSRE
jgi:hypothetical protein